MSEVDLESVAAHEIGYFLGLDHSSVPTSVMASGIAPGVIKRKLDRGDIAGTGSMSMFHTIERRAIHHSIKDIHHFISRQRSMCKIHLFRYAIIKLTRQALAKKANQNFVKVIEAYQSHNNKEVTFYSQEFMDLVRHMDTLLACRNGFLLGSWLGSSKQLAQDPEQEKQESLLTLL